MTAWQVLIIDNSDITIAGLCSFLYQIESVRTTDAASTFKVALEFYKKNDYDLILLNLAIHDCTGFDFLDRLINSKGKSNVLAYSDCHAFVYASKALKIGAMGYFSTDISGEEFINAVECVATGNTYIDKDLAQKLALYSIRAEPHPCSALTTREFEVFRLLSKGFDSHQISAQLCLSYKTTCNYVSKIKEKLNVRNNVQMMNLAHEYGLVSNRYTSIIE